MANKGTLCLQDFKIVNDNLKICKRSQVVALHKLVFEVEGDRQNRLRRFKGFAFEKGDEDYIQEDEFIKNNLGEADLIAICLLLGLNYDKLDPKAYILKNLLTKSFLHDANNDEEEDDDEDEEADDDEDEIDDDGGSVDITMVNRNDNEENPEERSNEFIRQSSKSKNNNFCEMAYEHDNERSRCSNREIQQNKCTQQPRFALNFRDIEDSIKPFDGRNRNKRLGTRV